MAKENDIHDYNYPQYNDYAFRSILQKRANGLLKFVKIPYRLNRMLISEVTNFGPSISRMDFVGEADGDGKTISLIIECQTNRPTDDDIERFFQYVSSIRIFKHNPVELYILCIKKPAYSKREFVLNDDCVYTMHVISLKDFRAKDIFKNIENKLKNNEKITDEDIAALQLIVYTDFTESKLEILNKARKLFEDVCERLEFDINEKKAIIYLFNVLSINMLDNREYGKYMEENSMILDPIERYMRDEAIKQGIVKGKLDTAKNMLDEGMSVDLIVRVTGLSEEDILNVK
jgi:predicted transposase/invertase (TIGR01784 family)